MIRRMAVSVALVAFAICILVGMQAENSFSTTVMRALLAMAVTLVIGLVVGAIGNRMLEENLEPPKKNLEIPEAKDGATDR
jgi:NhaP-type Na+/H+ or K+/H+ antiporter